MSKVLVIEDSSSLRSSITYILEQHTLAVTEAGDGEAALEIIKNTSISFDLIITDINMPELDGISFIKAIKSMKAYRYVPVIVLSTESQDAKIREGKQAGATGWLVKPFSAEKLMAVVDKVLDK